MNFLHCWIPFGWWNGFPSEIRSSMVQRLQSALELSHAHVESIRSLPSFHGLLPRVSDQTSFCTEYIKRYKASEP